MCIVDHDVGEEGTCTAFSSVEKEVGGDGGDNNSEQEQVRVPIVPVDNGEEFLGQIEDGEGNGSRQRQTLWKWGGVFMAVCKPLAHSRF